MCISPACLFVMLLIGAESPATLPADGVTFRAWTRDERAKKLGRSIRDESTGPLVTGVRAVPLMLEVLPKEGWKPREWPVGTIGTLTPTGVDYMFVRSQEDDGAATRPGGPPQHVSLRIAVHRDRDAAIMALGSNVLSISMGPVPLSNRVGDIAYLWPSPHDEHTSLLFRRDNVVVSLRLPFPKHQAIKLGERLDASLAAAGPHVDKGPYVKVPRIVLPASVRVGIRGSQHVRPELRQGDWREILISADDSSVLIKRSEDGVPELICHGPRSPAESETKHVTVMIATTTNVVASQQVAIEVIPEQAAEVGER